MAHAGKRIRSAREGVDRSKGYGLADAVKIVKSKASAKFDETVDIAINLGVDPKHADQMVRGAVVLPHGTGKSARVAVVAKGDKANEARAAGADFVGAEDLVEKIQKENWTDFDSMVATPDMMGLVGRLGRVLGPKGLMPNPKAGTVTDDVAAGIKAVKAGRVEFKMDKTANIGVGVGKRSFTPAQILENVQAVLEAVGKGKPNTFKGSQFIKSVTISSSMSPSVKVSSTEFSKY